MGAAAGFQGTVAERCGAGRSRWPAPAFVFDRGLDEVPANVWAAADEVFSAALELGGTLTGEHGVGVVKRRWLNQEIGEESMAVHRSIKDALDPLGIMNPGKVL
jgi:glycolate oxidase